MNIMFHYAYFVCSYRLRASGQPFIAYDPGMTRDALAYYGCEELFQVYFKILERQMANQGLALFVEHLTHVMPIYFSSRMYILNSSCTGVHG